MLHHTIIQKQIIDQVTHVPINLNISFLLPQRGTALFRGEFRLEIATNYTTWVGKVFLQARCEDEISFKGNPNFQGILDWILQIVHYYCSK